MALGFKGLLPTAAWLGLKLCSPASASIFNQYIGFGDSTLDSGWWAGALQGQCGGVAAPCTTGNAAKDARIQSAIANGGTGAPVGVGQMNSQVLAGKFGLTANPANQPGGTNYAISGAKNTAVGGGNLNPNGNLPSVVQQMATYLASNGGVANAHALYVVSSGGNDVTYANDNFSTLAAKEAFLSTQLGTLVSEIHALQGLGASTILIHDLYGTGTLANYYNATLHADLQAAGVHFIWSDIQGLVQTVVTHPTDYGFTAASVLPGVAGTSNTGSACVAGTTGWGQWCANSTASSPNHAHLKTANAEETSFFSDDQHFSDAGQRIEAEYDYRLLLQSGVPEPSTWALMLIGFVGLGLAGHRRTQRYCT